MLYPLLLHLYFLVSTLLANPLDVDWLEAMADIGSACSAVQCPAKPVSHLLLTYLFLLSSKYMACSLRGSYS